MRFTGLLLTGTLAIGAYASDALIQQAKEAGLMPIPAAKSELMKLINDPKNPITDAKVELGKKLYFDPRLSKSALISCLRPVG